MGIILKYIIRQTIKSIRNAWLKIVGFEDFYSFPFAANHPYSINIKEDFSKIIECLNTSKINYFLAEGVLLGLFRDGNFIKHDTDIDFYLINQNEMKKAIKILINFDYEIGRIVKYKNKFRQITFYNDNKSIIDFCYWEQSNEEYFLYLPEVYPKRLTLESNLFKFRTEVRFNNFLVWTFNDVKKYLTKTYGYNWNIPQKQKNNWKKEYHNIK